MRDEEIGLLARFKRELNRREGPPMESDPLYNLAMGWLREGPPEWASACNFIFCDGGLTGRNGYAGTYGTYGCCFMGHMPAFDTPDEWTIYATTGGVLAPHVFSMNMSHVTSNQSEFAALIRALCWLPEGWGGQIVSDSEVTLKRFYRPFETTGLLEEHLHLLIMLTERVPDCRCIHTPGHKVKLLNHLAAGNCLADELAAAAGARYNTFRQELDTTVDTGLEFLKMEGEMVRGLG